MNDAKVKPEFYGLVDEFTRQINIKCDTYSGEIFTAKRIALIALRTALEQLEIRINSDYINVDLTENAFLEKGEIYAGNEIAEEEK